MEARKEYNKKYYETHKEEIAKKLYAKQECGICGRSVNHQQIKRHQASKLCASHARAREVYKSELDEIKIKLNQLLEAK